MGCEWSVWFDEVIPGVQAWQYQNQPYPQPTTYRTALSRSAASAEGALAIMKHSTEKVCVESDLD